MSLEDFMISPLKVRLNLEKTSARVVNPINAEDSILNMNNVPGKNKDEQIVELIFHNEKARYLICCKNSQEADIFCRAIGCANSWIAYARYCQRVLGLKLNKKILEFFHDLIHNLNSSTCWKLNYFDLFTEQYNEGCIKSILEIIKKNKLIQSLEVNFNIESLENVSIDELITGCFLDILTNFPSFQLNELNIIDCGVDSDFLRLIQPGISHNTSLIKISLSKNLIGDKSLEILSSVFPNTPFLTDIDLSFNNLHGKHPYLENFINEIQVNLNDVKLNLSNNKIKEQCFERTLFYADKIYIKEIDISSNAFSTQEYWRLFMGYHKCKNRGNLVMKMFPIFFHSTYLKEIFQRKSLMTITLERSCFLKERKNPPTTKENIESIKQLERTIIDFFEQNCTVEQVYALCSKIEKLDYDFPSKKLDDIYDLIWDKLFIAKESHDHYSLLTLEMAALCIGLDVSSLKQQFKESLDRTEKLVKKLNQIINFEIQEEELNKELDLALKEAYELDIRGRFIDIITEIKEKRDESISRLINQNYQELVDDEQEEDKRDPFWFLDLDLEFLNLKPEEALASIDVNLMLHPMKTNYFDLCFISHGKLEQDLKFSNERVEKEQSYFLLNAYNRALFLIADHAGQRGLHKGVWENSRGDLKLNCSRLSIQYKNYEFRKELQSLLDVRPKKPYPLNYVVLNYSMPENPIGFQVDYDMSNYVYLRSVEEYFGREEIGTGENPKQLLKSGGSDKKLGANAGSQANKSVYVKKDILIYSKNPPSHISLRTSKQEEFNIESQNLQKKINIIFQLYVDDANTPENVIMRELREFVKKLILSRQEIEDKSDGTSDSSYIKPDTDELVDEAYLLLYKFTNRTTQDKLVNLEYVFRFLIIMTLFAPPSYDLEDHVRAWLLGRVSTKGIEQIVKKSLVNLANHYRDDFAKCFWIPSVWEINQRMKAGGSFEIDFFLFDDSKKGTVVLNDFATISDFMEEVYKHDLVKIYNDRTSFWVYKSPLESGEDVALYGEEVLFEKISSWDEGTYQLKVKRRIHNSFFTTSFTSLDEVHLESFFQEIKREFIQKDKFANFCKVEAVVKLASILYILWSKEKFKEVSTKPDRIEKKLKSFLPSSWLSLMASTQLSQRMIPILQTTLPLLSIRKLKEEFLIHLRSYFLFTGNIYEAQMLEISGTSNIRMPVLVLVNVFGIFFFNPKMKDKPIRTIFYEELVYFLGYGNECLLNYCEGDPNIQFKLNLMFKYPRGREINEDIISYSILRTKEKSKMLYAINNLPEFQQRFISTSSFNKKKTVAASSRMDPGDDDDELERELQEIMMTVEKELASNEFVFIIDKWFPFHEKCPLHIETEQLRKPPARPKKGIKQMKTHEGSMTSSSEILSNLRKPMSEEERERAEYDKTNKTVNDLLAKKGIVLYDPAKGDSFIPPPPIKKSPMENAKMFLDSIKPPPKDGEKPISKMSSAEFLAKLKMKPPPEKNAPQEKAEPDEKVPVFSTDKHTEMKMARPSQIERDSHEFGFNRQTSIKKRERKYQDEKSNTESSSEEPKHTGKGSEEEMKPPPQIKSLASLLKKNDFGSQNNDSQKEQQEKEERMKREKEQREREDRELREKNEREEKERKEKEDRERREKEEKDRRDREDRERREREDKEKKDREDRERREREDRERKEKEDRERKDMEERDRREREEKERKEREDKDKAQASSTLAQPKQEERRPSEQNRLNLNNSIFSALNKFPSKSNLIATPTKRQNDVEKFYELDKPEDNLNLDVKKLNPPLKPRTSRSSIVVVGPKDESEKKPENSEDSSKRKSVRTSIKLPEEVKRPSVTEKAAEVEESVADKNTAKNLSVKKQLAMKRNASNQSLSGNSVSGDSLEAFNEGDKSPEKQKEPQVGSLTKLPNFLAKKPAASEGQPPTTSQNEGKKEPATVESKADATPAVEEKPEEKSEPKSLADKLKMRAKKKF